MLISVIILILLVNLFSSVSMEHIAWLAYAKREDEGPFDYVRHPFFEPELDFNRGFFIIRLVTKLVIGLWIAYWCWFMLTTHSDFLTVYCDTGEEAERKKHQKWRFWRWGLKSFTRKMPFSLP